jgi:hypothetical protein
VTITGVNFANATSVVFGSTPAAFNIVNGTKITATTPSEPDGIVDVRVTNGFGTSPTNLVDKFSFHSAPHAPTITSVTPVGDGFLISWAPNPSSDEVVYYTVSPQIITGFSSTNFPNVPASCSPSLGGSTPLSVPASGSSSSVFVNACAGVPYNATMTATNQWGTSALSVASDTVVPMVAQPPSSPLITSVAPRNGALLVQWSPPALDGGDPLLGYHLVATLPNSTTVVGNEVTTAATSATYSGLTNGTTYLLTLTAYSNAGSSGPATAEGTPQGIVPPGPVTSLTAIPGPGANPHPIVVTWSAPSDWGTGTNHQYLVSYWKTLPGPACSTTAASVEGANWGGGTATITLAASPACEAGFNGVTIDGHTVAAQLSGLSLQLMTTDAFAINVGDPVVFDLATTVTTVATSKTYTFAASQTTNYFDFAVTAATTDGLSTPTVSLVPVTPDVALRKGAQTLTSKTIGNLLYERSDGGLGTYLVFKKGTTFSSLISTGSVLVAGRSSNAPSGVMAIVQSVSKLLNGSVVVDTTPASPTQAFSSLSFSSYGSPTGTDTTFHARGPGVGAPRTSTHFNGPQDPTIPINWDLGALSIDGQISFDPWAGLGASVDCTHSIWGICYWFSVDVSAGASVSASANLTASIDGSKKIPLLHIKFSPIVFSVGPVPIVILPEFTSVLNLSGNASVTVSAQMGVSGTVGWDSSSGFYSDSSHGTSSTGGPVAYSASGTFHAEGTAEIDNEFALCMYAFLCGNVQANGVLTATADYPAVDGVYFSICPSLVINGGLSIDILVWSHDWEFTLATFTPSPSCFKVTTPPVLLSISPPTSSVNQGDSVQLAAVNSDGSTPTPPTWALENPISTAYYGPTCGDAIDQTGFVTTACPGGNRRLVVEVVDDQALEPGFASIIVNGSVRFDPPGNVTLQGIDPNTALIDTQMAISWTAPTNTGGGPVVSYLVSVNGTTLLPTASTTIDVAIQPGPQTYVVEVTAINTNGISSPPTTATIVI